MPIRIYALAKQLKIDSKQLVETCNKAGVRGKGSALASLDDDEIAKVKAFMADTSEKPARPSPPTYAKIAGKTTSKSVGKTILSRLRRKSAQRKEEVSVGSPIAEPTKPEPLEEPTPPQRQTVTPMAREDYITPGSASKIKVIGSRAKKSGDPKKSTAETKKTPLKRGPVVKLAAMPKAAQPTAKPIADEPAPQKPIMTLPKDTIRGARAGSKAPLEQFTKHHDKKRKAVDVGKKSRKPPGSPVATPGEAPLEGKGRGRKRSKVAPGEETEAKKTGLAGMAGTRVTRQQGRKRRTGSSLDSGDGRDQSRRRYRPTRLRRKKGNNTAAPRKESVSLELPCSVRVFSEATGVSSAQILRAIMQLGTLANINTHIDLELAETLAVELEIKIELKQAESLEQSILSKIEQLEDASEDLAPRPPVVTFLGHVDHGKTSLLDKIIGVSVVDGEAGGITQHIRAYTIKKDGRRISFVDTPGHEAFTEMRARGANVTDIAILVVAADDGIMPQTEEAISHAKAADVPIIVALNKIDLPGANVERVMQQLSTNDLLPSEWGGDVEVVKTSAMTGEGLDSLLETIFLTADLHEFQANANRPATGVCLEAEQEPGRGVISKMIVKNGTLRVGDVLVCGSTHGRVKAMYDTLKVRTKVKKAEPSTPVNVTGLDTAPQAGEKFYVLNDVTQARELAAMREHQTRQQSLSGFSTKISFKEFQERLAEGRLSDGNEVSILNLILRADVRGSIEAIRKELQKLDHPEVKIKILQATVGGITVADVTLAEASDAVIVGFNVIPDEAARSMADDRGVEIRRYDIIYKVTEDLRFMLEGKLKPEERIKDLGRALVQQVFSVSKFGTIAGCRVLAGTIERGCRVRVNRDGRGVGDYPLDSLRREKDDAKEVREGYECGMKLLGFNDLKEGDVLEAYKIEEVARTM